MVDDSFHLLTPREREILALVHAGLRSKEIGQRLGISPGVVDNRIKSASRKTAIPDRRLLARRFADYDQGGVQRTIQRLDLPAFSLADQQLGPAPNPGQSPPPAVVQEVRSLFEHEHPRERWWPRLPYSKSGEPNDLSVAQRLAWIGSGIAAAFTLLVIVIVVGVGIGFLAWLLAGRRF